MATSGMCAGSAPNAGDSADLACSVMKPTRGTIFVIALQTKSTDGECRGMCVEGCVWKNVCSERGCVHRDVFSVRRRVQMKSADESAKGCVQ